MNLLINKKKSIPTILICLIIIVSFMLNFYAISNYGYGNEYYAASILSMTKSFKNFFYCAFDPSGILSVDKAPLGLWIQALFVHILGFKGSVLILPQAICGSLSCLLIYIMAKRYTKNIIVPLLSSLFFALTPIVVATARNNTIDMQLIFTLLLSLIFFFKFFENNKLKYLLLSSAFIGIGFNIKMLQAYLILPAVIVTYILFCKLSKSKKLLYSIISIILITIISFAWPTFVSLTPSNNRPYVDSTSNNSIFELITGHNGLFRITGSETLGDSNIESSSSVDESNDPSLYVYNDYIGNKSIFRLFYQSIYGQVSWLIIFAFAFLIIYLKRIAKGKNNKNYFLSFWSINFLFMFAFFSFSGFFHRYYLCMIAPSICILSACAISIMISYNKSSNKYKQYILPSCFSITMILEIINAKKFSNIPVLLLCSIIFLTVFTISLYLINVKSNNKLVIKTVSSLIIITILLAPSYWCLTTIMYVPNVTKPSAGPEISNNSLNISNIKGGITTVKNNLDLKRYLLDNYKEGSFLIAAPKSNDVAPLIIDTSLPALCTNGFSGDINYISLDDFKEMIENKKIRYFIIYDKDDPKNDITDYVKNNASVIEPDKYNLLANKNAINSLDTNSLQKKYNFTLYYFNN